MKKQMIWVLALFLTSFGFAQDVKLTHNLPSSATPGQTIDVEFTVSKGSIGAFAKFQCDLPAGFQAQAGDAKSGNFTFENNRVKIVWVSLPSEPTFNFTFKIMVPSSASGSASITAQFYYLENNVKKEFDVPPHSISFGGVATTNTATENTSGNTSNTSSGNTVTETSGGSNTGNTSTGNTTENTTTVTETKTTPVETKTTPVETKTTPTETKTTAKTTSSTSRSGVTYYIQVAALSSEPGGQYKKYGKTKVVQEAGMYKVLVGNYNSLEEARSHKSEMTNKGADGCFVVGYENGTRIKL